MKTESNLIQKNEDEVPLGEPLENGKEEQPPSIDWKWQIKNSICSIEELSKRVEINFKCYNLPIRITPYYLNVVSNNKELLKTVIPSIGETIVSPDEKEDPLNEESCSPCKSIVHRYPDRVLFLATDFCSVNCRYCTRSRILHEEETINRCNKSHKDYLNEGIDYIKNHPEIRDVLLSGGDPLTLTDDIIEYLLSEIRKIKHVEIIRIGTKAPVVLPMRITDELADIIKKYHPVYMSIHFTHPAEITKEVAVACNKLADAGIPLGSQTVLLKGVNDNPDTIKSLYRKLLSIRVRPYYLYQCDPIIGSKHFRTSIKTGLDIIRGLRGHTSGYAVPHYVIDAPGGGGKIPILPDYYQGEDDEYIYLKNYEDKIFKYPKQKE